MARTPSPSRSLYPASPTQTLFVVPPDGWYLRQPEPVNHEGSNRTFILPLTGMPEGASPLGQTFRFVAATPAEAIAKTLTIGE